MKVSPWPGRFTILNRNCAKDYGITVPSSNFFGDGEVRGTSNSVSGQFRFSGARIPASFGRGRVPDPNGADRSEAVSPRDASRVL